MTLRSDPAPVAVRVVGAAVIVDVIRFSDDAPEAASVILGARENRVALGREMEEGRLGRAARVGSARRRRRPRPHDSDRDETSDRTS